MRREPVRNCGLDSGNDPSAFGLDDVVVAPVATPVFQNVKRTNNIVKLTWSATPTLKYQVQYKTNALSTNWLNLGSVITASNTTASIT